MKHKIVVTTGLLLIILPLCIYYVAVLKFSVNIPYWDEYDCTLSFLKRIQHENFVNQFHSLFQQQNEHRIFSYSLTVLADYSLMGDVNFRHIILIGNLGMIGIVALLYRVLQGNNNKLLTFIPVILLVMMPQHEITNWGLVTFVGINQFLLVLTSLVLLNKQGAWPFAASVFLAIIATFSFGNGMFTFISGFIILFFRPQKSIPLILVWTGAMVLCIILYFTGYNYSTNPHSLMDVLNHPIDGLEYFLAFLGSLFAESRRWTNLFTLVGFAGLSFLGYLIIVKWKYFKANPLFLSVFVFIILSAIVVSVTRVGFGMDTASSPRYRLYPVLFFAILYIASLNIYQGFNNKIVTILILCSIILYSARLTKSFQKMDLHKQLLTKSLITFYTDQKHTALAFPDQKIAVDIIKNAVSAQFYKPPKKIELVRDYILTSDVKPIQPTDNICFNIDKFKDNRNFLFLTGWAFAINKPVQNAEIVVVLKSAEKTMIFRTIQINRMDVRDKYPGTDQNCGFSILLPKLQNNLPPQSYLVGIGISKNGTMLYMKYTDILMVVSPPVIASFPVFKPSE